jgi:uncharacterized Zn finger protein
MSENKPCNECGGTSFGTGEIKGYGAVIPTHKILSNGSPLILNICTNCGLVNSLRVKYPEKFKKKQ